jgi:hypothetical protein
MKELFRLKIIISASSVLQSNQYRKLDYRGYVFEKKERKKGMFLTKEFIRPLVENMEGLQ